MFSLKSKQAVDNEIIDLVYADQMGLLYRSLTASMLVSIALAILWLIIINPFVDSSEPFWWLAVFVLVASLRCFTVVLFKQNSLKYSCRKWEILFIAGVLLTSGLWATAIAWVFPYLDGAHQVLLVLFLAGLHMGALSTAAARPLPMPLFVLISFAPLVWHWLGEHNQLPDAAMIMFAFYLLVIGGNGRRLYLSTKRNFTLGLEAKQSEQRFRAIVDNAGDALLVVDHQGKIVDVNKTACELIGSSREHLLGLDFKKIESGYDRHFESLLGRLQSNEVVVEERQYQNKQGELIPVHASESLYSFSGDSYVVVIARDLSKHKQRELELKTSKTKLDLHVSQTPLAVIDWDTNFKVTAWNAGAEKIFGFTAEEIIGKHAYETIIDESDKSMIKQVWKQLMNNSGGHHNVNQNLTKDGRIIVCEWYNTSLTDEQGKVIGVASMVMDITERVETQKALYEAKQKAEQANLSKTKFLSRMSHELRTPLNAIIGFSSLLKDDTSNTEYINAIESSGKNLLSMINEILDLSRLEQGKLNLHIQDFPVANSVKEAVTTVLPMARKKTIQIEVDEAGNNMAIKADLDCFRQILVNLLSNAVKYSDDGSKIYIRTKQIENEIKVEVQDSGRGIAKDKQHLLFNEFERAGAEDSNIEGAGIGLMICRHMAEQMKGRIGFESEEGKGSCFWLMLPKAEMKAV